MLFSLSGSDLTGSMAALLVLRYNFNEIEALDKLTEDLMRPFQETNPQAQRVVKRNELRQAERRAGLGRGL